jgi:hypothetical protein
MIIRTLMGEAHQVDEALLALVRRGAKRPAVAIALEAAEG